MEKIYERPVAEEISYTALEKLATMKLEESGLSLAGPGGDFSLSDRT